MLGALVLAPTLSACSDPTIPLLPTIGLPKVPIPHLLRTEESVDKPANLIERALSECDKRVAAGEAACVKAALVARKTAVVDLMAMVQPCHQGQICHYRYTTEDRVGFYAPIASRFVVHWRVDFDFTHPASTIDAVPITATEI